MSLDLTSDPVALTRALCDIESVSGGEGPIADAVEEAVRRFGHLEVLRDGDAVVARTRLGRPTRVVIAGHLDTVPVNGNLPVTTAVLDGEEHLVGRGTVDMKAGVAVQLHLAAALDSPVHDVTWVWYDHEEVAAELNGLGRLAARHPDSLEGDFAILGEPTAGRVEGGCNGNLRVEITVPGVRAHSARSWMGVNAIHRTAELLDTLSRHEPREVEVEGLVYREGLNAVRIRGGVAGNVIPDECVVEVNYRFSPDQTSGQALDRLRATLPGHELVVVDRAEGARPGLDAPAARRFVEAVGGEPMPKYGWTDVARFSALGVPAVNYGPGDPSKAHADDESVPVAQIRACADALRSWLSS